MPMTQTNKQAVTYFIADLHLTQNRSDITTCFISFLEKEAIQAKTLYILGDLFESWIGDDDDSEFVTTIASALLKLKQSGTIIYYIHGNRDFLIGKKYAKKSGMILLPEIKCIDLHGHQSIIMHGDTLCIDDVDYQKFRKKSRSWWWQTIIKSLPLSVRRKIAENYRKKSSAATALKSQEIMDVNPLEVIKCLETNNCQWLIHGHTHRPFVHNITANNQPAKRIVLGDWYEQGAWLKVSNDGFTLMTTSF